MKRRSFVGPIILILIGLLFLANNLRPELPILKLVGDYWPLLLIAWGVLRLFEIFFWYFQDRPMPRAGIGGGEWVLIVFLCLVGSGIYFGHKYSDRWPQARITTRGIEMLGELYDFPLSGQLACGKTPRILVENSRGNIRVVGGDVEEVKVTGRTTVRAFQQADAEKAHKKCPLEVVTQGDQVVVRTNQDRVEGPQRVSADLEVTVPRGATRIEVRGKHGDFDINEVAGSVDVNSDNAGVRLNNIGGEVRVDLRRSDIVRAVNVKGNVEIKGGGWDVELENIQGQASINGSYSGELTLRNMARPVRFESSSTELRVERAPGHIRISRGDLTADDILGPVVLKTRSKDIQLRNFSQELELSVDRGDIELRPGRLPLARMDVRTGGGNIELAVPQAARFELRARTNRGEVENDYSAPLAGESEGRAASLKGAVGGGGPAVNLETQRGTIVVRKGGVEAPTARPAPAPPKAPGAPSSLKVEQQ